MSVNGEGVQKESLLFFRTGRESQCEIAFNDFVAASLKLYGSGQITLLVIEAS